MSTVGHRIGIGSEHEFPSLHTVKPQVDKSLKSPIPVQGDLRLNKFVGQGDFMLHKSDHDQVQLHDSEAIDKQQAQVQGNGIHGKQSQVQSNGK